MRTAEDFKTASGNHGIERWDLHECSFCHYPVAYLMKGAAVAIDTGCWCVPGPMSIRETTWDEVAEQYNMQTTDSVIARYDEFWHFETAQT